MREHLTISITYRQYDKRLLAMEACFYFDRTPIEAVPLYVSVVLRRVGVPDKPVTISHPIHISFFVYTISTVLS